MAEGHKPTTFAGKLADPDFRRRRAVNAAKARNSVDAHINALIKSAPSLTAEQADRLSSLLSERGCGGPDQAA